QLRNDGYSGRPPGSFDEKMGHWRGIGTCDDDRSFAHLSWCALGNGRARGLRCGRRDPLRWHPLARSSPVQSHLLTSTHEPDSLVILPHGADFEVVGAVKNANELSPWCLAALSEKLPEGSYKLAQADPGISALGWLLAQHRFETYRSKRDGNPRGPRILVTH